jgi:hypothetical protein
MDVFHKRGASMQIAVNEKRLIDVRKAAKDRVERCTKLGLCLACEQPFKDGEASTRGLHIRCYHATRRAIVSGKTTERERMADGKLGEAQLPGRKPSNPVSTELS